MLKRKDFSLASLAQPLKVGELVTVVVKVVGGVQEEAAMQKLLDDVDMEVVNTANDEVYAIKELVSPEKNDFEMYCIHLKFSVKKSGFYTLKVYYKRVFIEGSPVKLEFLPGEIDATKTVFLRESPFLTFGSYYAQDLDVQPKDKFDNFCKSVGFMADFQFHLFQAGEMYAKEDAPVEGVTFEVIKGRNERVRLRVKTPRPGIFRGKITYKGKTIQRGSFRVLVISREESVCFHSILAMGITHWPKFEARLMIVGSEMPKSYRKVYLQVYSGQIEIGEYFLKIFPLKLANFRICGMLEVKLEYASDDDTTYCLTITDRIQTPITVEIKAVSARVMLSLYSYYLRRRIGGTENFEGKQRVFYRCVRDLHEDGRFTRRSLRVNREDLIESTIKATKGYFAKDWCKNFRVEFKSERGIDGGGLRREWLNKLCKLMFGDKPDGMFASIGSSGLVHPLDAYRRNPKWKLHHYRLAGLVVGKCLYETAHGDAFRQMVNAKFTRSFLAQIVGTQPNYSYFEDDDPELFTMKIKYILSHDCTPLSLTFTEEDYDSRGKLVKVTDLIYGGSKIFVTNENKEEYLNLVAKYRLVTKVQKEVEMFLKGLHEIVPADLLCNFDERELEVLLCGKQEFDIDDLRLHSNAASWQFEGDSRKLLEWFWAAVARMSESEKEKLLEFTTGSGLLPPGGFKSLYPQFNIEFSTRKIGSLPTAVTCVNRISLADHLTFESFENALKLAIEEGNEGFGFG